MFAILLAAYGPCVTQPEAQQMQPVTVHVTCLLEDGTPVANAGLEGFSGKDGDFGLTDAAGMVHLSFEVDLEYPAIVLRLWDGVGYDLDVMERVTAVERFAELRRSLAFRPRYTVPFVAGQAEYAAVITARPAVSITMLPVDEVGAPIDVGVGVRGGVWTGLNAPGDPLTVHGVPQGQAADLFVWRRRGQAHVFHLTAAQTEADASLGEVAFIDRATDAALHLTCAEIGGLLGEALIPLWEMVTLIPSDGDPIITFPLTTAGIAADGDGEPPAALPAGEYWIAPGPLTEDVAMAVYDAVRAGNSAALDAAGVPKVTIAPGEAATITIDAPAARDAIYAATGGPPAPDAP